MTVHADAVLMRIFVGEDVLFDGMPAWKAALEHLRIAGAPGATVVRGRAGFSAVGESSDMLEISYAGFPIVVEAIASPRTVDAIIPDMRAILGGKGLLSLERVETVISL